MAMLATTIETITAMSPPSIELPLSMPFPYATKFEGCNKAMVCVAFVLWNTELWNAALVAVAVWLIETGSVVVTGAGGADVLVAILVVVALGLAGVDVVVDVSLVVVVSLVLVDTTVVVTEDKVRPDVRGCVSRDDRSDC